ncbi:MAG: DUF975 family protein [Clostridiales bacterium]|nr:DUF975 family protein [Clostridiales bacterium]
MDHVRMIIGAAPMKKIARQKLKEHWLESATVFIIYSIFAQGLSQIFLNSKRDVDEDVVTMVTQNLENIVTITLVLVLLTFFLAPPILVGGMKYILKLVKDEDAKFSDIFYGFTCYWRSFKQYFLFNLIIALPILILVTIAILITSSMSQRVDTLLLSILVIIMILFLVWIVYAIVMKIGLLFKFFVIADEKFQYNGAIDSLKTCYSMMKGNKAHLFGVIVSFIGWYLLAILPSSIFIALVPSDTALIWGNVITLIPLSFVSAYAFATFAVYYRILRGELKIDIVDEEPQEINREFFKEIVHKESQKETTKESEVEIPENAEDENQQ